MITQSSEDGDDTHLIVDQDVATSSNATATAYPSTNVSGSGNIGVSGSGGGVGGTSARARYGGRVAGVGAHHDSRRYHTTGAIEEFKVNTYLVI